MSTQESKSIAQRITEAVARFPDLTEREISRLLFGPDGYQQRVNSDCQLLVGRGVLRRLGTAAYRTRTGTCWPSHPPP